MVVEELYIPHGSDESNSFVFFFFDCDAFISHMVQMKEEKGEEGKCLK